MRLLDQIWLVDFEFHQLEGGVPRPICMVARNLGTSETQRIWLWENPPFHCPLPLGPGDLYVAFLASAEMACHLALGWPMPVHVLDLSAEFRLLTSGQHPIGGKGLLGTLSYFGLHGIDASEKEEFRALAVRGGPYTESEKQSLLTYCESDVTALADLLPRMMPYLDLIRALIRGRFMKAVACAERNGVPIDQESLDLIRNRWDDIRRTLIDCIDEVYGVYEGSSFRESKFMDYCARKKIRWPLLETGSPDLKRATFKKMARLFPQLLPLYDLRCTLGQMRLNDLAVGMDGRNRYLSGTFGSKTGRNQPSSAKAVFGPSRWIRHLIKPAPGMALAYVDYCQQELGIAAALSGDEAMKHAYRSGDPYIEFAKLAGEVPPDATKSSHPAIRDQYKVAALGILMGMGADQLGIQTSTCEAMGRRLLRQHKEVFTQFWKWSDAQVDRAHLGEYLTTVFGWQLRSRRERPTTLRNFKLQANGADMLRLAAIAIAERDIRLCAMIHDAVLVEAPLHQIDEVVAETRRQMAAASRAVLGGFELDTDVEIIRHPNRFRDERGRKLWETVTDLLGLPSV